MKLNNNQLTISPINQLTLNNEYRESSIEYQLSNSLINKFTSSPINSQNAPLQLSRELYKSNLFLQNEPNFKNEQIYISPCNKSNYGNFLAFFRLKNEPKRTQNEPNFSPKLASFFPKLALFWLSRYNDFPWNPRNPRLNNLCLRYSCLFVLIRGSIFSLWRGLEIHRICENGLEIFIACQLDIFDFLGELFCPVPPIGARKYQFRTSGCSVANKPYSLNSDLRQQADSQCTFLSQKIAECTCQKYLLDCRVVDTEVFLQDFRTCSYRSLCKL